jgi:ATP-dependent Lon protease
VKKRVLEYLAVRKLKNDMRGPILCLSGPPGVGKTSLGQSISRAIGRKFVRLSLGGVRDEAEIRGHRRTYVGALPGRFIKQMKNAGSRNPIMLLDEIDKLGSDFRGDPSAALLEVLDPEQNNTFSDHYLDIPFDLSKVMFIATANRLDTIPAPLRDRMEIIEMSSYTFIEKEHIARNHLIPKQLKEHGITADHFELTEDGLNKVIQAYAIEPGVRTLERRIAELCRSVAVQVASGKTEKIRIDTPRVEELLGPKRMELNVAERTSQTGVSVGLTYTALGFGDILFIEATKMPGKGTLTITGQLGDVMKESVSTAFSWLRANADRMGLPPSSFEKTDIHIHFPDGATPKDGPSAGIAITTALTSLFTGIPVRSDTAMTGEITLRGIAGQIGGVREKVLGAHRAGIKRVLLPEKNKKDLVDVPEVVRNALEFHFVSHVDEALKLNLERSPFVVVPVVEEPKAEIRA